MSNLPSHADNPLFRFRNIQLRQQQRQGNMRIPIRNHHSLQCVFCSTWLTNKAQKAILLADNQRELFSSDQSPRNASLIGVDYSTEKCRCLIRNIACLTCGNNVGYHVSQPCRSCLDHSHNGHFFMFHCASVKTMEGRKDSVHSLKSEALR
jgi:FAM72 protein|eukprot:NODE_434_length_8679_cov_0.241142.p6 type:complete len:151 gc:universal NODE_434_length_8679_cov_0.241142:2058-2510(+)